MDSNTHSTGQAASSPAERAVERPDRLAALAAAVDDLAAQDLDRLTDAALAEQVLGLRRLLDALEGQWLRRLAAVDGRGAAGADQDQEAASTAAWLRQRLRLGPGAAAASVRTARALFRGPLPQTARALTGGELSPAHASVLAHGTRELPAQVAAEAEPVLVEAAQRLDPPRLRRVLGHLQQVLDPDSADGQAARRHQRRGVWLAPTWDGLVALDGLLEAEAGQTLLAALEPLARPVDAHDARSGGQRTADALTELARRALEAGRLPRSGGVRPQLLVTVDLESLLGRPGAVGGEAGWVGPLDPEACRRLACDSAVTRVLVSRHPSRYPDPDQDQDRDASGAAPAASGDPEAGEDQLTLRLRAALALLPPVLGGAPCQPLDLGRAIRVVSPAQRSALAVRDGGCVVPGCQRPLAWCEGHHLGHWLDGGRTDLGNLALVCRAHHRAVHEGGWRLGRGPDGRFTAIPPHRRPGRHPPDPPNPPHHHQRHPTAA